jgi:hypothetical protein
MPPWFADPNYGHFANQRRLSDRDIATLAAWADSGAAPGDPTTAPAPLKFESGWNITPDVVVEMPKPFELPARGTINYKYVLVRTNFKEDMWVTAAEMRPGDPAVLHHGKVWVRPPGSTWMEKAVPGEAYEVETQRDILGKNAIEARSVSIRKARRSSSRRDPISYSSCTTRPRASRRATCRRSGSCWPRIRRRPAITSTPDRRR